MHYEVHGIKSNGERVYLQDGIRGDIAKAVSIGRRWAYQQAEAWIEVLNEAGEVVFKGEKRTSGHVVGRYW